MSTFTFATGPVALDEDGDELRARFASLLSQALERDVAVVACRSYTEVAARIARDEAQAAWLSPAVFARNEASAGLHLLAAVERSQGAGYRGVLFVPKASEIRAPSDLSGKTVAWVDRDSCAGYLFPRLSLRALELEPAELFAEERFEGSHGSVVRAVMNGTADAGATHAQTADDGERLVLAGWQPYAGNDGMRPLLVTDPIPPDVLCATVKLGAKELRVIEEALLSLHERDDDEVIDELFNGPRFVAASPSDYDAVRLAMK